MVKSRSCRCVMMSRSKSLKVEFIVQLNRCTTGTETHHNTISANTTLRKDKKIDRKTETMSINNQHTRIRKPVRIFVLNPLLPEGKEKRMFVDDQKSRRRKGNSKSVSYHRVNTMCICIRLHALVICT